MKIFLAGGAGYIGTHTAVELLNNGYEVVIVDDYANSCPEAVARVEARKLLYMRLMCRMSRLWKELCGLKSLIP